MRTTHVRPMGPRNQVTIPVELVKKLNMRPHDMVSFSYTEAGIVMKPVIVVDKKEAWSPDELDVLEKIIEKQVKAGKYVEFSGSKKAINRLKKKKNEG